jgi:ABC-type lipoprotein release transport system permease subunit
MSNNPYLTPETNLIDKNEASPEYAKALKMGKAIKVLSLSFVMMVVVNTIIYAFFQGTILIYIAIPFALAYWLSVTRLSWLAYSPFMGIISFLSIMFPVATFIIMLMSYSRAAKYIKDNNLKMSFLGDISWQHE